MGTTYLTDGDDLTSVANAIRAKSGGSSQLAFPAGFVSEIQAIPSGGGVTADDVATGAFPSGDITLSVLPTLANAFFGNPSIQKVTATYSSPSRVPGTNLFQQSSITEFVAHNALKISMSWFLKCESLKKVTAPKSNWYDYQAFRECVNLEVVDLGTGAVNRGAVFYGCKKLQTVILRSTSVCSLGNVNNFDRSPFHPAGGTGITGTGTLYVPASLVASYKTATNWSTLYSDGTMDVQSIEGSIYENAYADGTPIT